jgi:HTH-type transcriptional regulator / antitoxin HigA
MDTMLQAAEVFPAGEYLRDELDERGWTVTEFAEILARPVQVVSEILNSKKEITTDTALAIGDALGTSPELWLSLQTNYRLFETRRRRPTDLTPVARRARLRGLVPLAEVRQRGWVTKTEDLDVLEDDVQRLLGLESLAGSAQFALAARRSNSTEPLTLEQTAWLAHVRRVAADRPTPALDLASLSDLAASLSTELRHGPSVLSEVPKMFEACGVALVFSEGLRGGKLDGAVTFLPDGRPVVGITTRGDRFDSVLFTILHECAHLTRRHIEAGTATIIDDDLSGEQNDPREVEANSQALGWLFPDGFHIESTTPTAIAAAAVRYHVHPSVVLGQVHKRTGNWTLHRTLVAKVRSDLLAAGLMS